MRYSNLIRKIAKNKKGFDPDFTDITIAVIIAAVTFFFVFIYMAFTSTDVEKIVIAKNGNVEDNYLLLSYLRSPMEKTGITVSEYFGMFDKKNLKQKISKSYKGDCLEGSEITLKTKDIFKNMDDWRLTLFTVDKLLFEEKICYISNGDNTEMPIAAIVPSNDPTINIGLRLGYKS